MDTRGHIEIGVPSTLVAILCAIVLVQGGDGLPLWLRIALIAAAAVFAGLALLTMATPRWPNVALDERPPAEPREPQGPVEPS
ncbi:MAG TPA: hypothetical protein VMK65_03935 [Longimicrobiales bacterium]|nr:hypothetical protein [Longimicrobiales bacterium]